MFSEDIGHWIVEIFGKELYLILAFSLALIVPLGIFAAIIISLVKGKRGTTRGVAAGFSVACWASLCWLVIPYCGAYPNLIGGVLALAVFEPGTMGQEIVVHLANLIIWPPLGWLVFRRGRSGGQVDKAPHEMSN